MVKLRKYSTTDIWRRLSMPALYTKNDENLEKNRESHSTTSDSNDIDNSENFGNIHRIHHNKKRLFSSNLSLNWLSHHHDNVKSSSITSEDVERKLSVTSSAATVNGHLTTNQTFNRANRHAFKQISLSTPTMTQAHSVTRGPTDPDGSVGAPLSTKTLETTELIQTPGSSKARQKKFHRHFKQVGNEERVLNYYSCALVGDILLQGHLYITKNYFAFYSNVFGYVTKLLIPTVDVLKVSKEKTARIIPNAVGISTEDEKHVFGSLLSRDSTYKLMVQVWKAANCKDEILPEISVPKIIKNDVEDSASGELLLDDDSSASGSGNEDATPVTPLPLQTVTTTETLQTLIPKIKKPGILTIPVPTPDSPVRNWSLAQPSFVLTISTALLVTLFLSAGFLLYRISKIQNTFYDFPLMPTSGEMYQDIFKWQSMLHSRSANEMHDFLNKNLNQIEKVRLSLEALSMLIFPGNEKNKQYYEETNLSGDKEGETNKDDTRTLPKENS